MKSTLSETSTFPDATCGLRWKPRSSETIVLFDLMHGRSREISISIVKIFSKLTINTNSKYKETEKGVHQYVRLIEIFDMHTLRYATCALMTHIKVGRQLFSWNILVKCWIV